MNPSVPKLIDPRSLHDLLAAGAPLQLVDVRQPEEVLLCRLPGSTHIPMNDLPDRLDQLDPKAPTVVYCHHGVRSQMAAAYLLQQGFADVANLRGGIDHYAAAVDPSLARY